MIVAGCWGGGWRVLALGLAFDGWWVMFSKEF